MAWRAELTPYLAPPLQEAVAALSPAQVDDLREVRLRVNQPVEWVGWQQRYPNLAWRPDADAMQRLAQGFLQHSAYAHQAELRRGYLTVGGGHRLGLCGKVMLEGSDIVGLREISSLCLRLARPVPGVADWLLPVLIKDGLPHSTLLFSAPGLGKTTLLRDAVRQLADGVGQRVAVVDERGELAGCIDGVPQLYIGSRTDVLDGCPKAQGLLQLLRTMAPQWLAVDEIGSEADAEALLEAARCGVPVLATAHAGTLAQLRQRPMMAPLWQAGAFTRYVGLAEKAVCAGVWDAKGTKLI